MNYSIITDAENYWFSSGSWLNLSQYSDCWD